MVIPKSLDECKETDLTAREVWKWAGVVETGGKIILVCLAVLGIISSVSSCTAMADIDEEKALWTFIISLISWALAALIEFAVYKFFSTLLYALASIVESVRASAKIELYKLGNEEKDKGGNVKQKNSWACACGFRNAGSDKYCTSCGKEKHN